MAMESLNIDAYNSEGKLTAYMKDELLKIQKGESSAQYKPPTIHKVPNSLRNWCHEYYDPQLISIGPLHCHRHELRQMEHLKWTYLQDLISRYIGNTVLEEKDIAIPMAEFVKAMWEHEKDVRKHYSVDIGLDPGKFVEVLVLDGCFLIELFVKRATGSMGPPWGDAKWNLPMLRNDLLLLENQIPFSVLIALFEIAFPGGLPCPVTPDGTTPPPLGILDLALRFIAGEKAEAKDLKKQPEEIHHLLHLNHICLLLHFNTRPVRSHSNNFVRVRTIRYGFKKIIWRPLATCFFFFVSLVLMCKCPRHRSSKNAKAPRAIPSVKTLREGGIKFKKKRDDRKTCLLNVSFDEESGKLEIPFLSLQESSISFIRNLIAFEQCSKDIEAHFTAYATFMDNIIDTAEDVEILVRHGIIESKLGFIEYVVSLFNDICKGATLKYEQHYLADLFTRVDQYYDSHEHHMWRVAIKDKYFGSPLAVASTIAAVIIILLTLLSTIATIWQTIYTVKSKS